MDLYLNNKYLTTLNVENISEYISKTLRLQDEEYYLLQNGKQITLTSGRPNFMTHIILRLPGGKGGFGSMLRAIGAQIEKTTNREACRDLSGRRLRDINEEKRLKAWIDSQNTRDQEAADRKQKKLERLCQRPRHEFRDETYDRERSALPERLEDAVEQGLAASCGGGKRKSETQPKSVKKKKAMFGLEDLSSGSDVTDSEDDEGGAKAGSSSDAIVNVKSGEDSNKFADNGSNKADVTVNNKSGEDSNKYADEGGNTAGSSSDATVNIKSAEDSNKFADNGSNKADATVNNKSGGVSNTFADEGSNTVGSSSDATVNVKSADSNIFADEGSNKADATVNNKSGDNSNKFADKGSATVVSSSDATVNIKSGEDSNSVETDDTNKFADEASNKAGSSSDTCVNNKSGEDSNGITDESTSDTKENNKSNVSDDLINSANTEKPRTAIDSDKNNKSELDSITNCDKLALKN